MGLGFAIPSNMAKSVMQSLVKYGKVVRGWIGVSIQEVTQDLAQEFGATDTNGALVADVMDDGPASKAKRRYHPVLQRGSHSRPRTTTILGGREGAGHDRDSVGKRNARTYRSRSESCLRN